MCSSGTIISSLNAQAHQGQRFIDQREKKSDGIVRARCSSTSPRNRQYGSRISAMSIGGGSMLANLVKVHKKMLMFESCAVPVTQLECHKAAESWSLFRPSSAAGTLPDIKPRRPPLELRHLGSRRSSSQHKPYIMPATDGAVTMRSRSYSRSRRSCIFPWNSLGRRARVLRQVLNDLHVQDAEESTAKAEAQSNLSAAGQLEREVNQGLRSSAPGVCVSPPLSLRSCITH